MADRDSPPTRPTPPDPPGAEEPVDEPKGSGKQFAPGHEDT